MNKTTRKQFFGICEASGWRVVEDGENLFTIEKWSPEGEDWPISLSGGTLRELADDLNDYCENFDPEEHAAEIFVAKRSGDERERQFYASAPDSIRALLIDAETMKSECEALRDELYRAASRAA